MSDEISDSINDQQNASGEAEEAVNKGPHRLFEVNLDPDSIQPASPDVEHERAVAIFDLIEDNRFSPIGHGDEGPFRLDLSMMDRKLVLDIHGENGVNVATHILSLTPFRRIIKDYFMVCDSYHEAIKTATPSRIEAIDMGRRGLHNEGSQILQNRLEGKIETDFQTARPPLHTDLRALLEGVTVWGSPVPDLYSLHAV